MFEREVGSGELEPAIGVPYRTHTLYTLCTRV